MAEVGPNQVTTLNNSVYGGRSCFSAHNSVR